MGMITADLFSGVARDPFSQTSILSGIRLTAVRVERMRRTYGRAAEFILRKPFFAASTAEDSTRVKIETNSIGGKIPTVEILALGASASLNMKSDCLDS